MMVPFYKKQIRGYIEKVHANIQSGSPFCTFENLHIATHKHTHVAITNIISIGRTHAGRCV
jgi:hypothetical protein